MSGMNTTVDIRTQHMDPGVSAFQGRLVFHQERLLRSTGGDPMVAQFYREKCEAEGLPHLIAEMTPLQVQLALYILENVCEAAGWGLFRDCKTNWECIQ
mgnify:FL=1